jgi:hypothetical protein
LSGVPAELAEEFALRNYSHSVRRSAVAVPTRNDATTGYRFAVTRCRSKMDSNRRSRLFDRKRPVPASFRFSTRSTARLKRTGERLASDSDQSDVYVCPEKGAGRHETRLAIGG